MTAGVECGDRTIAVPLRVGDRVTLLEDVEIEEESEGSTGTIMFEDYVEQYVPKTGLLQFEDSDIGRASFLNMVEAADGIEILEE